MGRVVSSVGNGGVNAVLPVWQSEETKPKSRGKNVVVVGILITSGMAAAGWVNVGMPYVEYKEVARRFPPGSAPYLHHHADCVPYVLPRVIPLVR